MFRLRSCQRTQKATALPAPAKATVKFSAQPARQLAQLSVIRVCVPISAKAFPWWCLVMRQRQRVANPREARQFGPDKTGGFRDLRRSGGDQQSFSEERLGWARPWRGQTAERFAAETPWGPNYLGPPVTRIH